MADARDLEGKPPRGVQMIDLARVPARAAGQVKKDMRKEATERERLARDYRSAALRLLKEAVSRGELKSDTRRQELLKDGDFKELHDRKEFKDLLSRPGRD